LGAKIGRGVYLGTDECFTFDLLTIGDGSSVGNDAYLLGYVVADGMLTVGPVTIGRECYVGNRCVLRENSSVGDGASLEDLSMLPAGAHVPSGECWAGAPARPVPPLYDAPSIPQGMPTSRLRRVAFGALHALGVMLFPSLMISAIFPGIVLMN